jgi:Replication-relaxation
VPATHRQHPGKEAGWLGPPPSPFQQRRRRVGSSTEAKPRTGGLIVRNVQVRPASPQTRVSLVEAPPRPAPDQGTPAPQQDARGSVAPRAPIRPPTLEPAPLTVARPHVTAATTAPTSAADWLPEAAAMPTTNSRKQPRPRSRRGRPSQRRGVAEQLAALAGRLTDRDRAILRLLGEHRVLTTHQLAEVFFHSQDRAEHRLRELTDARALARFRPHTCHGEGSAPFHYVLGPLGAVVLAAEQGLEPRGYWPDKALAVAHSQRLAHVVGVNGFFAALAGYARRQRLGGAALVVWWSERRCIQQWGGLVRPDGYGRWREDDGEVDFFLEYDRGTEPLQRLTVKLIAYGELANATQIPTPVLFWLPSLGRETSVRQALGAETRWSRVSFLVVTATPELGRGPAEAAWLPLDQTRPRRRLIELGSLAARTPHPAGRTV